MFVLRDSAKAPSVPLWVAIKRSAARAGPAPSSAGRSLDPGRARSPRPQPGHLLDQPIGQPVDLRPRVGAAEAHAERAAGKGVREPERPQHVARLAGPRGAGRPGRERELSQGGDEGIGLDALEGDVEVARKPALRVPVAAHARKAGRESTPQLVAELREPLRLDGEILEAELDPAREAHD